MHGKFCARIACNIDQFDEILNSIEARVHKQKLFSPATKLILFCWHFRCFSSPSFRLNDEIDWGVGTLSR